MCGFDPIPDPRANVLLATLPDDEFARLRPRLTVVELASGDTIHEARTLLDAVYFPLTGCGSIVASDEEGDMLEVGTAGREGMIGLAAFHGTDSGPLATICQVPGDFARLPLAAFRAATAPPGTLHQLLHRYSRADHIFAAQSAACNRFHAMPERCARWLLLTHDRCGRDTFHLTHEYLGYMLGVRRPGVTVAMGTLQAAGLIAYRRGEVHILDRAGLEYAACACYDIITREYAHLLGRYPKGAQAI